MPEDHKKTIEDLYELYRSQNSGRKLGHFLIIGQKGAGKTSLVKTCPAPVLIHSFDPGGTDVLISDIEQKRVIPDTRYENDRPEKPTAYKSWKKEMSRLLKSGIFSEIGTYVLDSTTTLFQSLIWQILEKEKRKLPDISVPLDRSKYGLQVQDWGTILQEMVSITREICKLPCHTMMLGHIGKVQDEVTGQLVNQIVLSGQAKDQVPINVGEVYVLLNQKGKRTLLTQNKHTYSATTRMGSEGRFAAEEKPDIRYLLQKAGFSYEDIDQQENVNNE